MSFVTVSTDLTRVYVAPYRNRLLLRLAKSLRAGASHVEVDVGQGPDHGRLRLRLNSEGRGNKLGAATGETQIVWPQPGYRHAAIRGGRVETERGGEGELIVHVPAELCEERP